MMEAEFGYEVTYIPFPGGGTVAKNLVGNHIDSTVNNPAEQNEFYQVQATPSRWFSSRASVWKPIPDIPTAKELGRGHRVLHAAFGQRPSGHERRGG